MIMDRLNIKLCAAISPRELFRVDGTIGHDWEFRDIGHPDDMAGFDNLRFMGLSGRLDYVDFAHTPSLENLWLSVTEWPAGFSFVNLPNRKSLHIKAEGAAACQLFNEPTLERLFAPLGDRLDAIDLAVGLKIPPSITDDADLAAESLGVALGLNPDTVLDNGRGRAMFGDWDSYSAAEKADAVAHSGYGENVFT